MIDDKASVTFSVLGEPKGKGRPRFTRTPVGVRTHTPQQTVAYENLVRLEYSRQTKDFKFPDKVPLEIVIFAYFTIPKSTSKKKTKLMLDKIIRPTKKPDADNIEKIIADSLNTVAYKDDSQIVDSMVRKFYDATPRVEVRIRRIDI